MSILLDALKKSEQERQLGQTPTLRTGADEHVTVRPSLRTWVPVSMALLSVAAIGWFGWQQFKAPIVEEVAAPVTETQTEAVIPEPVAAEPDVETHAEQGRTLTELYGLRRKNATPAQERGKTEATSDRGRLSQSVSRFKADREQPRSDEQAQNAPLVTPEPLAQASKPNLQATTEHQEKRKSLEPHVPEPISYWELPQRVRDDLPEIKITVLVFAEQPGDRFLLSNGQRIVEKDELGGGLVLDEIRKDGAVFLYRNYRFLVKG